jgi:hypothetical protein
VKKPFLDLARLPPQSFDVEPVAVAGGELIDGRADERQQRV